MALMTVEEFRVLRFVLAALVAEAKIFFHDDPTKARRDAISALGMDWWARRDLGRYWLDWCEEKRVPDTIAFPWKRSIVYAPSSAPLEL